MKKLILLLLCTFNIAVHAASPVKVNNKTDIPIWVQSFKTSTINITKLQPFSGRVKIEPNSSAQVAIPSGSALYYRRLGISETDMQPNFFQTYDMLQYKEFYIARSEREKPALYNPAQWKVFLPVYQQLKKAKKTVEKGAKTLQQEALAAVLKKFKTKKFKFQDRSAFVRVGSSLSRQEQAFRVSRQAKVRTGLEKILGRRVREQNYPVISLCVSGGGYRAMLAGTAFLAGAQEMGLLDSSMYISTLSGSTWGLSSWLVSGMGLDRWVQELINVSAKKSTITTKEWKAIQDELFTKLAFKEEITSVDVWGADLARKILEKVGNQQKILFSPVWSKIIRASVPWPICTAVSDNISPDSADYKWFEFSPDEVGSTYLNAWIPLWAYGRTFNNGKSTNAVPEQTLGFLMGVWGSAFSVAITDVLDRIPWKDDPASQALKEIVDNFKKSLKVKRIINGGIVPNFSFGLASTPAYARKQEELELVDAGYSQIGNPFPPLLRPERKMDIIVVCDVNESAMGSPNLKTAQEYARRHGLRFPKIDLATADKQPISVYGDPYNLQELVVIFLPRIQNKNLPAPYNFDVESAVTKEKWASTDKFKYSKEKGERLTGWAKRNIISHKEIIKNVIEKRLRALNPR